MNEPIGVPIEPQEEVRAPRPGFDPHSGGVELDESMSIQSYKATHQTPFVSDYFGVKDLYTSNTDVQRMVNTITDYALNKVDGDQTVGLIREVVDGIAQETNIKDNDAGYYKLKKVFQLVEARHKLEQINEMRSQALEDILKFS